MSARDELLEAMAQASLASRGNSALMQAEELHRVYCAAALDAILARRDLLLSALGMERMDRGRELDGPPRDFSEG